MYNFYGICVLCKSPVLCGVVPRLYTQVSRAEVTTSKYTGVINVRLEVVLNYRTARYAFAPLPVLTLPI